MAATELVKAIRKALQYAQERAGGWVRIAELRDLIDTDASRDEIDAAILLEYRELRLRLSSEANHRVLDIYDHAAAISIGGDPVHWIALAPRNGHELTTRVESVAFYLGGRNGVDLKAVCKLMWDVPRKKILAAVGESRLMESDGDRIRIP